MSEEKPMDKNCWEYHLGVLYGALRAYGAPVETMKSHDWLCSQIVQVNEERRVEDAFDRLGLNGDAGEERAANKKPRVFTDLERAKMYHCLIERGMKPSIVADIMVGCPRDKVLNTCYTARATMKRPSEDLLRQAREWLRKEMPHLADPDETPAGGGIPEAEEEA